MKKLKFTIFFGCTKKALSFLPPYSTLAKLSDTANDISEFEVCLGTTEGECDVVDYRSVGLNTIYNFTELKLRHEETYYVTVKATNNAGLSTQVVSDEIKIDITPPQPVKDMSGSSLDLEEICSPASGGSCNTTTSGKLNLL